MDERWDVWFLPLVRIFLPHKEGYLDKAITPLTVTKPYWYGRDQGGNIVIRIGAEQQRALDVAAFAYTAQAFIKDLPKIRRRDLETCGFCGGAFDPKTLDCDECGRPAGTPIDKETAFEILLALFPGDAFIVDQVDRDFSGAYTIAFTRGDEPSDETAASIETTEQWHDWKRRTSVL